MVTRYPENTNLQDWLGAVHKLRNTIKGEGVVIFVIKRQGGRGGGVVERAVM